MSAWARLREHALGMVLFLTAVNLASAGIVWHAQSRSAAPPAATVSDAPVPPAAGGPTPVAAFSGGPAPLAPGGSQPRSAPLSVWVLPVSEIHAGLVALQQSAELRLDAAQGMRVRAVLEQAMARAAADRATVASMENAAEAVLTPAQQARIAQRRGEAGMGGPDPEGMTGLYRALMDMLQQRAGAAKAPPLASATPGGSLIPLEVLVPGLLVIGTDPKLGLSPRQAAQLLPLVAADARVEAAGVAERKALLEILRPDQQAGLMSFHNRRSPSQIVTPEEVIRALPKT